jgi:hypothetical protein
MIVSHVCITEGTQIGKLMVFLQSCTVSLPVVQRSCSESSVTSIGAYGVISVKREDSDMDCQEEEMPIAISFPKIKCEQDEVSYISVCPLLGALCQYSECLLSFVASISLSISPLKVSHFSEEILPSVPKLFEVLVRVTVCR